MFKRLFGAALIFACCNAFAADEKEIADLYRRGLQGDSKAVDLCIEKLEAALQKQPDNALARVYLGSSITLRSRDMNYGPGKLATLRQGCRLMDEAVAAAPEDLKVRLVRALTDQALPFFLGRKKSARADFIQILSILEKNPEALTRGDCQVVYFNAGITERAIGDPERGTQLLRKAAEYPVDPAMAAKVNAALEKK